MSSKQRRRNQKKARREATTTARSVNGPFGDFLKDRQDPEDQSTDGDQTKPESNCNITNITIGPAQEAVNQHQIPNVEQSPPVATPDSSSVFSLTNRLSPDPDSVRLEEAATPTRQGRAP